MIDITPDPIFLRILGFPIYWYGICYAVGLAAAYWVLIREARFRGLDENLIGTGMIVVAIAALVGGRLYHVIDQWALYKDHPLTAFLPLTVQPDGSYAFSGFTGLGVPGGIISGTIVAWVYVRRTHQDFWRWADVVAPALFVMQAIGRWGNFFNQELYGPPTSLPWGIKIDCAHRVADFPCTSFPLETTHFQPLFLYESLSGIAGFLVLTWLARRRTSRFVPGDLLLVFFVWYGLTRFALEGLRHGPGQPGVLAHDLLPKDGGLPKTADDDEDDFWADDEDESTDDDDEDGEFESDDDEFDRPRRSADGPPSVTDGPSPPR